MKTKLGVLEANIGEVRKMIRAGVSLAEVGRRYGLSDKPVQRLVKKHGIPHIRRRNGSGLAHSGTSMDCKRYEKANFNWSWNR